MGWEFTRGGGGIEFLGWEFTGEGGRNLIGGNFPRGSISDTEFTITLSFSSILRDSTANSDGFFMFYSVNQLHQNSDKESSSECVFVDFLCVLFTDAIIRQRLKKKLKLVE